MNRSSERARSAATLPATSISLSPEHFRADPTRVARALVRMAAGGETFHQAVMQPLRNHDLTRRDVTLIFRCGQKDKRDPVGVLKGFGVATARIARTLASLRRLGVEIPS